MLWDINVIPNEQDNGYLMLPPGVLHMSALGRFGRFTLFSPRVSPSKHLPCSFCFVLCFGFGVFVALLCFCFLFCKCFGIPNSPRSLDLDDRQGLIASSAMQQKKNGSVVSRVEFPDMILEDVALFFADIHVQWREVSWWLCRIHHASTTSALSILSAPNYVVVTERDYEAFGYLWKNITYAGAIRMCYAFGYPGDMTITVLWSPTALEFVWFLQFGCFDPIWWYNIV